MSINYKSFLNDKDALSFERCGEIHEAILNGLRNDEEMLEIWQELLKASMNYAYTRSLWLLSEPSTRRDKDDERTAQHEKVIYNIILLSRYMQQAGQDIDFLIRIMENRKQIGDFASYLAYIYALNAR